MYLREARRRLRMTQVQLAKALHCSRVYISMIENGKAPLSPNKERLVRAFLDGDIEPELNGD